MLIKVESASVNYSDTMRRRDLPYPFPTRPPFVPGGEVAGTVHAWGPGVDGPPVGTPVFALAGADGSTGYAQYALADSSRVVPVPEGLSCDEACGLVIAGGTAMLALTVTARLSPGESVLVEGAGGAVGSFVLQLAKHLGAGTVIGAAGTAQRREAALAAGADAVVDYTADGWIEDVRELTGGGADVVLHCSGGDRLSSALAYLAPFGRLVVIGLASGEPGVLTASRRQWAWCCRYPTPPSPTATSRSARPWERSCSSPGRDERRHRAPAPVCTRHEPQTSTRPGSGVRWEWQPASA